MYSMSCVEAGVDVEALMLIMVFRLMWRGGYYYCRDGTSSMWFFMLWPWPWPPLSMAMVMAITVAAARFYLNP
jgi:hypothetical protein